MTLIESLRALAAKWNSAGCAIGPWVCADELLAVLRQWDDNPWNDPILGGTRMEREQPSNGEIEVTK